MIYDHLSSRSLAILIARGKTPFIGPPVHPEINEVLKIIDGYSWLPDWMRVRMGIAANTAVETNCFGTGLFLMREIDHEAYVESIPGGEGPTVQDYLQGRRAVNEPREGLAIVELGHEREYEGIIPVHMGMVVALNPLRIFDRRFYNGLVDPCRDYSESYKRSPESFKFYSPR